MLARVYSCAVIGLDGVVVEVEVDTGGGLPKMVNVGSVRTRRQCMSPEAALSLDITVNPAPTLIAHHDHLTGPAPLSPAKPIIHVPSIVWMETDFC